MPNKGLFFQVLPSSAPRPPIASREAMSGRSGHQRLDLKRKRSLLKVVCLVQTWHLRETILPLPPKALLGVVCSDQLKPFRQEVSLVQARPLSVTTHPPKALQGLIYLEKSSLHRRQVSSLVLAAYPPTATHPKICPQAFSAQMPRLPTVTSRKLHQRVASLALVLYLLVATCQILLQQAASLDQILRLPIVTSRKLHQRVASLALVPRLPMITTRRPILQAISSVQP